MSDEQVLDADGRCVHWRQRVVAGRYVCYDCRVDCGRVGRPPVAAMHVPLDDYPTPFTDVDVPQVAIGYLDGGPRDPSAN